MDLGLSKLPWPRLGLEKSTGEESPFVRRLLVRLELDGDLCLLARLDRDRPGLRLKALVPELHLVFARGNTLDIPVAAKGVLYIATETRLFAIAYPK